MKAARAWSVALIGMTGAMVEVEAAIGSGLPRIILVGLPDASLYEARDRCRAAMASAGLRWPADPVTINLSPATLPKTGSHYDLSIVAAVGAAGGGCDPEALEGRVLFGGRDVREYTCDGLLRNISMVFQNVYLFEDTILNNIRFGKPDATMEEVREAARKARCHDFIMALPEGYETPVGEGGVSLSGGERQRISLARAMLKDAPVIILDEATASVDPENERQLQEAFEALTRDKTVIMIAHRLSTVRKADQILVLDKGRIIQRGRHEELMEQGGLYADFIRIREQAVGWSL